MEPELTSSKFGFVENAEIINSRAAMVSPTQKPSDKMHLTAAHFQNAAMPQQKASHTVSHATGFLRR
jgi:hypothetical protein